MSVGARDNGAKSWSGKNADGIDGAGVNALRTGLWEYFLEAWGYDIRTDAFDYYGELGMKNNVAIVGYPADDHRDKTEHCATNDSKVFDNLWEPIWDNGENGTPVNDDNYLALYLHKLMPLYGDNIKFYEIWNEPDFDYLLIWTIGWQTTTKTQVLAVKRKLWFLQIASHIKKCHNQIHRHVIL